MSSGQRTEQERQEHRWEKLRKALVELGFGDKAVVFAGAETRGEKRLELNSRGIASVGGRFDAIQVLIRDISPAGLGFECTREVRPGDPCVVMLSQPGLTGFRHFGTIAWIKPRLENDLVIWWAGMSFSS